MRILIPVQKVAAIIEHNIYEPRADVLARLQKKYAPTEYATKFSDYDAQKLLLTNPEIDYIYQAQFSVSQKLQERVYMANFKELIYEQKNLLLFEKDNLIEFFRRQMSRSRGIPVDFDDERIPTRKRASNIPTPHLEVSQIRDSRYFIVGKKYLLEDHQDNEKRLVEIKNRMHQMYQIVPQYEYIELQVSLQLLGIKNARLVQNFCKRTKAHDIIRDDNLWNDEILPKIQSFCQELASKIK